MGSGGLSEDVDMVQRNSKTFSRAALVSVAIAPVLAISSVGLAESVDGAQSDEPTAREKGGRECFFPRQVNGFRNVEGDEDRILVDVRAGETFEFELQRRCPELRFARSITFDQRNVGRICDGLDVDLLVPDPQLGTQRCPVTMIGRLGPDDAGARAGSRD